MKSVGDRKISREDIDWSNLRNWGGESLRSDAKNCFYPVIVENAAIIGFGEVVEISEHPKSQTVKKGSRFYVYPIDKEGVERKWRYARQSVDEVKHLLRGKETKNGFEIEIGKDFGTQRTVWIDSKYDASVYGTQLVKSLVPGCKFDFPKSLWNVYDCIFAIVANDKSAIILDFFGGSGTTAHAVLELNKTDGGNRQFILCEQMHYVETVTKERVKQVIKNNGSGAFVYLELKEHNESFISDIKKAETTKALLGVYEKMKKEAFFRYEVDVSKFDSKDFSELPLKEQKQVLLECLDKNHLYVNYSEIDDTTYKVSSEDKNLNKEFYGF